MATPLDKVKRPLTRKGKAVFERRAPQIVEPTKRAAFIRGKNANDYVMKVMKDLANIKKPHSVSLSKKNDFLPFEDATSLEFVSVKNESPLFVFSSHTKKRPNNLIMGRMFDGHVLDMFEFGVENVKLLHEFKNQKVTPGVKPLILFSGEAFENDFEYMKLKNYFLDFFVGPKADGVRLSGLESVIQIVAVDQKIHFRHFRILLKKSGTRIPRIELDEIGPRFDLVLRRFKLASHDLYKYSMRQPQALRAKKVKNVNVSVLGTTFGRVHMERQDYGKLAVKQVRSFKRSRRDGKTMSERFQDAYGPVAGKDVVQKSGNEGVNGNESVNGNEDANGQVGKPIGDKAQSGRAQFKGGKRLNDDERGQTESRAFKKNQSGKAPFRNNERGENGNARAGKRPGGNRDRSSNYRNTKKARQ